MSPFRTLAGSPRLSVRSTALFAAIVLAVLSVAQGAASGPASATNALLCDQNTLYGVNASNQLASIDVTTGTTTVITSLSPANNGLGLARDGAAAYGFNNGANSVTEYDAATGTTTIVASVDPAGNQTVIRGAVNPATGLYYYGGSGTSATIGAYDPTTGTKIGEVGVITGLPAGNGDFAFSTRGLLFVVAANEVLRVNATTLPATAGTTSLSTSLVATLPSGTNSPGIAFSTDGFLYVSSGSSILKLDPASGALLNTVTIAGGFTPTDLGSCNYANTLSAQSSVDSRWRPTDQFGLSVTGGGIVSGNTATTAGTATGLQPQIAGAALTVPQRVYTATQTAAGTTDLADYSTTYSCIDINSGNSIATGAGDTTTFTFPAANTADGTDVMCTFTNSLTAVHSSAGNDSAVTTGGGSTLSVDAAHGVLSNDIGTGLTVASSTQPLHGTAAVAADGSYTYTPVAGFSGTDTFSYTATDSSGTSSTGTVTITVTPAATDDTATANAGAGLSADPAHGVLANDNGSGLTSALTTGPTHGTLILNVDGSYTYTPTSGYSGPDSFTYQLKDASGQTATATMHLTVLPTATADAYSTTAGTALTVAGPGLLSNDLGTDLVVVARTAPAHGTVSTDTTGALVYTPTAGFSGDDTFDYTILDASGGRSTATVTVTVNPTATGNAASVIQGGVLSVTGADGVLAHAAGSGLTATLQTSPRHGRVILAADGSYTYTPDAGFAGIDTFTYVATASSGGRAVGTITITVLQPGASTADTAVGTAGQPTTLDPLANDTATQGSTLDPSTLALVNPATGNPVQQVIVAHVGTWGILNAHIVFTPAAGFAGRASIDYQITDTAGRTSSATVTVSYPADVAPPAPAGPLAETGSNIPIGTIALGGLLCAAAGGVLLVARLRRRSQQG